MSEAGLAVAAAWVAAGFGFGLGYFATLRRTVELFSAQISGLVPLALTLGRIAAAIIFLGIAARCGALALLMAFLGFLLARALSLRAARRTA